MLLEEVLKVLASRKYGKDVGACAGVRGEDVSSRKYGKDVGACVGVRGEDVSSRKYGKDVGACAGVRGEDVSSRKCEWGGVASMGQWFPVVSGFLEV